VKPTIVIIGAGSVEFTRELLGDILSFPELGSVRVVLHDIDAERLETRRPSPMPPPARRVLSRRWSLP
jgi:alpha-galactosidase/6-phospho-beta-glucosidase family protein